MSDRVVTAASLVLLVGAIGALAAVLTLDSPSAGPVEARTILWRQAPAGKGGSETPPPSAGKPRRGRWYAVAEVRPGARVRVYASPGRGGAEVGPKTRFGSPVGFAIVRRRGHWLGVSTPTAPNGRLGWIRDQPARVQVAWTRYSLEVDLSRRRLSVRYGNSVVRRFVVTVGAGGTETPVGRYGVTDRLLFDENPAYGCCALALSGRQTRLPEDWPGGDRLAIHGTAGPVGGAESHGCVRADERTMRYLIAHIPIGTPVFVKA